MDPADASLPSDCALFPPCWHAPPPLRPHARACTSSIESSLYHLAHVRFCLLARTACLPACLPAVALYVLGILWCSCWQIHGPRPTRPLPVRQKLRRYRPLRGPYSAFSATCSCLLYGFTNVPLQTHGLAGGWCTASANHGLNTALRVAGADLTLDPKPKAHARLEYDLACGVCRNVVTLK